MKRLFSSALLLLTLTQSAPAADLPRADTDGFQRVVAPFFKSHCIDCHGPDVQEGELSLHDIDPDLIRGEQFEQWRIIDEQLRFGDMPPEDEPQPKGREREAALQWIRQELLKTQQPGVVSDQKLVLPEYGNYVDHDALFNRPAGPVIPAAPRLWRMRPEIYERFVREIGDGDVRGVSRPFTKLDGTGIKDFAAPYFIDEPTTDMLLANAEKIVEQQVTNRHKYRELRNLVREDSPPTPEEVQRAVEGEFRLALRRVPTEEERQRFTDLWKKSTEQSGHVIGGRTMLMGILMRPEALFRLELGGGPVDALGRQRLSQREIAIALSFALRDRTDRGVMDAAGKDELTTRDQVIAQVERMLADPKGDNTRIMQFFREYFGYPGAADVFKDPPERGKYNPGVLVSDLEFMIRDILEEDKDVFYQLLTTNKTYVNLRVDWKRGTRSRAERSPLFETVYGLPPDWKWTEKQPIELPAQERCGVLTHPAWLVAWSGNFDNHPVQRGKWVRTHLLGGTVPDVPIGVDARIPEDEHKTLRERLAMATGAAECWRCHKKMDPLGLPLEQFDHYGNYRKLELDRPVETGGAITRTGDERIEGNVSNPLEMIRRLARSERAEQVFVRHAFRFFMGRNETLGDAKTLQDAHRAYRESGGSFNALVVSLLSSDSFLYRTADDSGPSAVADQEN